MTREEAIKVLEYTLYCVDEETPKGANEAEAIPMAIEALQTPPISQRSMYQEGYRQGREEALKREPQGDLISRAEAIEALGEEPLVWCDEEYEIAERSQWRDDVEAIKSVPSADRPRGEWISKEELIGAINDAEFVYDGDEDGHKEHDISELVRVTVKDIIGSLSSADMRGDDK